MKKVILKGNDVSVEFTCNNCNTVYQSNEYTQDVIKTYNTDKEVGGYVTTVNLIDKCPNCRKKVIKEKSK